MVRASKRPFVRKLKHLVLNTPSSALCFGGRSFTYIAHVSQRLVAEINVLEKALFPTCTCSTKQYGKFVIRYAPFVANIFQFLPIVGNLGVLFVYSIWLGRGALLRHISRPSAIFLGGLYGVLKHNFILRDSGTQNPPAKSIRGKSIQGEFWQGVETPLRKRASNMRLEWRKDFANPRQIADSSPGNRFATLDPSPAKSPSVRRVGRKETTDSYYMAPRVEELDFSFPPFRTSRRSTFRFLNPWRHLLASCSPQSILPKSGSRER